MSSLIRLRSSDGVLFELEEAVAMELQLVASIMEDGGADTEIPIPNVDSKTLAKVIEYCKKHVGSSKKKKNDDGLKLWDPDYKEDDLKSWDAEYIADATLADLLMAANYLNVKGLLDLGCQTVADMMKGKTPEEIRKMFNIKNDFTPEEEEEIKKEHSWLFG